MSAKYDLEKPVSITLSQAKMAVLMELCTRLADLNLAPEEELVLREIEASAESEVDFIMDADYKSILAEVRRKLRDEAEL